MIISTMKSFIPTTNYHLHFTGSLPGSFILDNFYPEIYSKPELENAARNLLHGDSTSIWSDDKRANNKKFFEIYEQIQSITRMSPIRDMNFLYEYGTKAIIQDQVGQGSNYFEILSGPKANMDETLQRLISMSKAVIGYGYEKNKSVVGIRLTFIKNSSGEFINLSNQIIDDIFRILGSNEAVRSVITGFDFSGLEEWSDTKYFFEQLDYLFQRIRTHKMKYNQLTVSVHAGENFYVNNMDDTFAFFEKLMRYPVKRIGHGTVLWISNNDFTPIIKFEKDRRSILKELSRKDITLDICPTANLLLTPLSSRRLIPLNDLDNMGVRFTINSDNPTIFNTNIEKERNSVGNSVGIDL